MSVLNISRKKITICLCLALMTGGVFGVAVTYDFVNYDDIDYVTDNPHVQAGLSVKGVIRAFTTTLQDHKHWHPLTLLSHMLDCQLFGLNPAGHHFTSILLHVLNTILLFMLLERMTKALWPSVFVAALFAIHPLHVEPVVWIASRKDVLSTFFMLMTLWVYVSYTEHPGTGKYLLALCLFAAGLLSKSMLVTLPFVMLLLDYWPLGRLTTTIPDNKRCRLSSIIVKSRVLWEKLPFLLLSVIVSTVMLWIRPDRSSDTARSFIPSGEGFVARFIDAVNGYASYVWKMFCPTNLSVTYQKPDLIPIWQSVLSFALLIGVSYLCLRHIKRRSYLLVGWLWFLGMLVPVSGIIKKGPHLLSDRYTYTSFIGLFIMLSWCILEVRSEKSQNKRVGIIAMIVFLAMCSILSLKQISYWKNSITLFSNAITVNPNNMNAQLNLGLAIYEVGNDNEAIEHFNKAVQLAPHSTLAQYGLGYVLCETGQWQEAIDHLSEAIRIAPNYGKAYTQLGICSVRTGNLAKAHEYFIEAIKLNPDDPKTYYNYGYALALDKRDREAFAQMKKSLDIDPYYDLAQKRYNSYTQRYNNLEHGIKLYDDGKMQEAEELLKEMALRFPEEPDVYLYLGLITSDKGQPDSAISYLLKAIKARPEYTEAHVNLGIELARKKEYAQAEKAFSDALTIEPNHVKAHYNYAVSLYLQNRRKEAMEQLAITLRIDPDYKKARDMLDALRGTNIE